MRSLAGIHSIYTIQMLYVKFSMLNLKQVYLYKIGMFVHECTRDGEVVSRVPKFFLPNDSNKID